MVDGPPESCVMDTSPGDQSELLSEELNQSTTSEVNKANKTNIVKTHGEKYSFE